MNVQDQYTRMIVSARSGNVNLLTYHIDKIFSMYLDDNNAAVQIIESKTPDMAVSYFLENLIDDPSSLSALVLDIKALSGGNQLENGGGVMDFILKNVSMRDSFLSDISLLGDGDFFSALRIGVEFGQLSEDDLISAYNPFQFRPKAGGFENVAIEFGMNKAQKYFKKEYDDHCNR